MLVCLNALKDVSDAISDLPYWVRCHMARARARTGMVVQGARTDSLGHTACGADSGYNTQSMCLTYAAMCMMQHTITRTQGMQQLISVS
jgi:hypothetical protein